MLLISAGALMIRLEYIERYKRMVDDARIHGLTEYIVSRYEAGMDTRDFRRSSERRGRFPRIVIRDMDTALIVFSSRRDAENFSGDIYWDYVSRPAGTIGFTLRKIRFSNMKSLGFHWHWRHLPLP